MIPFHKEEVTPPVTNINLLMYFFYLITGYKGTLDYWIWKDILKSFSKKRESGINRFNNHILKESKLIMTIGFIG